MTPVCWKERGVSKQHMVKLTPKERDIYTSTAYPYINEYSSELEWWVFPDVYDQFERFMAGQSGAKYEQI